MNERYKYKGRRCKRIVESTGAYFSDGLCVGDLLGDSETALLACELLGAHLWSNWARLKEVDRDGQFRP